MDLIFLSTVCELVLIISLAIKLGIFIWIYLNFLLVLACACSISGYVVRYSHMDLDSRSIDFELVFVLSPAM